MTQCNAKVLSRTLFQKSSKSLSTIHSTLSRMLSSCTICLSSIFHPASLTCGHRFCEKCLGQYWDTTDRPDFIVCPLCRACAYNVSFEKKDVSSSTEDFRRTFNILQLDEENQLQETEMRYSPLLCLKLSLFIPLVYYVAKWLRVPFLDLLLLLQCKLGNVTQPI